MRNHRKKISSTLGAYKLLTLGLSPIVNAIFSLKTLSTEVKEELLGKRGSFGHVGEFVWFHAASVGITISGVAVLAWFS